MVQSLKHLQHLLNEIMGVPVEAKLAVSLAVSISKYEKTITALSSERKRCPFSTSILVIVYTLLRIIAQIDDIVLINFGSSALHIVIKYLSVHND